MKDENKVSNQGNIKHVPLKKIGNLGNSLLVQTFLLPVSYRIQSKRRNRSSV